MTEVQRYRLPGSVSIGTIVPDDMVDSTWPGLIAGWVWLLPDSGAGLMAAERAKLEAVGPHRDLRTIGGGLTIHHTTVPEWVENNAKWEIPILRFESRGAVKLRKSDVDELIRTLTRMRGEMPPEPYIPSGSLVV